MNRQFTATGATVEEAIENACKELGVSPEDVTPEVLRFPKKGFLGLGKTSAEVRVTVLGEEEPKKAAKAPAKKAVEPKPEKPAPQKVVPPVAAPTVEKQAQPQVPSQKAAQPVAPVEKKAEIPAEPAKVTEPEKQEEELSLEQLQPKMDVAREYLTAIFEKMGVPDIQLRMEPAENRTVMIHLEGGDIGTVIGKRGETLDAIQYLVSLAANRSEGDYVRFTINAGNYREKREETLRALAQRMARKVLKTGRPAALEPMNPYERRIIHAVVTDIDGVFSKSTGEEPNRKVVIKPTAKPSSGAGRRDGGSSKRSGGKGGRSRNAAPREQENVQESASAPVSEQKAAPAEKTVLDDNIKLYSKIEL